MCYVFGVNDAMEFKRSLTREYQLKRMDTMQKILKGIEVPEGDMQAVGSHFAAPPPKTVVGKAKAATASGPTRRLRKKKKVKSAGGPAISDMVSVVVEGDVARSPSPASRKARKAKKSQDKGILFGQL